MNFTKQSLTDMLHKGQCQINFTKINGEQREMICTLDPKLIPVDKAPKASDDKQVKHLNENVLNVYSLDRNDWRSFRISNVTAAEIYTNQ